MKDSFASRMRKAMEIRDMKQADLVECPHGWQSVGNANQKKISPYLLFGMGYLY